HTSTPAQTSPRSECPAGGTDMFKFILRCLLGSGIGAFVFPIVGIAVSPERSRPFNEIINSIVFVLVFAGVGQIIGAIAGAVTFFRRDVLTAALLMLIPGCVCGGLAGWLA